MSNVKSLEPHGINSTMFTTCCDSAIRDQEANCPSCGTPVIGHDAESDHERGRIRWRSATEHWDRSKLHSNRFD